MYCSSLVYPCFSRRMLYHQRAPLALAAVCLFLVYFIYSSSAPQPPPPNGPNSYKAWLPDGDSRILRLYVFGPSGFWTMAPLRWAAKFDPFLSLDCAPTPSTLAQSKERK